jgi:hypothetical protein
MVERKGGVAIVRGSVKVEELEPIQCFRFHELENKRNEIARILYSLLDPKNKLGRYSPHYFPALRDLMMIEAQIDGLKYAFDLETSE